MIWLSHWPLGADVKKNQERAFWPVPLSFTQLTNQHPFILLEDPFYILLKTEKHISAFEELPKTEKNEDEK